MTDRVEAIIEQGRRAKAVLDNPTVMEALDYIADQTQRQWRATSAPMAPHRETLFHQVAALDSIKRQLEQWVAAAKFEQDKLDKANDRKFRIVR